MTDDTQQHWNEVYDSRAGDAASWFQAIPSTSVRLVGLAARGRPGASVIDVGAGTSTLVDTLLEAGHEMTVLDVSGEALATVADRLGSRDAQALAGRFATTFDLEHQERELHATPTGAVQAFTWVVLRRR